MRLVSRLILLVFALIAARPAAALELIGVFDGNDFYSEGNGRCTVCEILGDDQAVLLARLERSGSGFDVTFDGDKSGTWTRAGDGGVPTHLVVKAGPNFALYKVTDPDSDVWTTEALRNRGGQQPGLSHLSFYVSGSVPEPGALALVLVAGLGLALRRARPL